MCNGRERQETKRFENALDTLRQIAYTEARRIGLKEDDASDCAMSLVLQALNQWMEAKPLPDSTLHPSLLRAALELEPSENTAWLRRCARNFALNFRRGLVIRRNREVACCKQNLETHTKISAHSAEADALRHFFRHDVYSAVSVLSSAPHLMFASFHLHEHSIAEIAHTSGKSQSAVKQSLHRSRCSVRAALLEQGHGTE